MEQFVNRLRLLSTYCNFHEVNKEIIQQVIQTCTSKALRRELLKTEYLDIEKLMAIGRTHTIRYNRSTSKIS